MYQLGLMYAMPAEIQSMLDAVGAAEPEIISGIPFYKISDSVIACAGGVGKVNAAMAAQVMIDHFHPSCLLNAGVAGDMAGLEPGTPVLVSSFCQHDVDTTAVGDPRYLVSTVNQMFFPTSYIKEAEEVLSELGISFHTGLVASGDWFAVDSERARRIRNDLAPLMCEMEGCAIAQVCQRNEVPFLALKTVSDHIFTSESSLSEYQFNFPQAMKDLNDLVLSFTGKFCSKI